MKLLYIIINDGFSDDVLDLLDKAGVTGATIIPARGWEGKADFLSLPIEPAKEIIISVVEEKFADEIGTMINGKKLLPEQANGLCLSLEVADVNYINKIDIEENE